MASAKKLKNLDLVDEQSEFLHGEDTLSKYWNSHLFNTVYLRHDLSAKHEIWDDEEDLGFQNFLSGIRDLAKEYKNRERELEGWSETETINNWVKHVLNALGWANNCTGVQNPYLEETSFRYNGKTYRTDILIVDHPREKQHINSVNGDEKLQEVRQTTNIIPVEVKYWQRLEEYRQGKKEESKRLKKDSDDITRTATPDEQTVQYMEMLKKDWGILTDGARWRLYNREVSSEDSNRYYEFNLFALYQAITTAESESEREEVRIASKYFYHFFSKSALVGVDDGKETFVNEVMRYSKKYVNKVEQDLKERFVKAMNIACNGLHKAQKSNYSADLLTIRNVAESALFNVLFIRSLESRGVLPMSATDYKKISLSNIVDKIEKFDPKKEEELNVRDLERAFKRGNGNAFIYKSSGTELHEQILRLNMVIHDGNSEKDDFGFEISGFKESVFSDEEWKLFKSCKISNKEWVEILFQLTYADSESLNRKYQQIPYSYFTPRQLGSIYESFLEFKIDKASESMVFEKKQWKPADLKSRKYKDTNLPKVEKHELFFTPDNEDRKATGSFYTPDYIVQSIVYDTLRPLVSGRSSKEILDFRVCDPAMGSGHFLVASLNFLTKAYLSQKNKEAKGDLNLSLPEAKREVLHSCIFGVDINSRAVKLAQMSLWLESAHPNKKLERLDDQLKAGDSIIDQRSVSKKAFSYNQEFPAVFENGGFDAVVGNPPWVSYGLRDTGKLDFDIKAYLTKYYPGSAEYKVSLYACFVDRFAQITKPHGRFGVIVPDSFLLGMYFSKLRRTLLEKSKLEKIMLINGDFWGSSVCSGFNAILIAEKSDAPEKGYKVQVERCMGGQEFVNDEIIRSEVPVDYYWRQPRNEFRMFFNAEDFEFVNSLEAIASNRVSDFVKFSSGLIAKGNKEDIISKKPVKDLHKGIVSGGSVHPEKIEHEGHYISFDKTLLKSGFKDARYFEDKLVVRQTADSIICGLDREHYLYLNNVHVGNLVQGNSSQILQAVFCALNSNVINNYYKLTTLEEGRAMAQIDIANLDKLPLPKFTNEMLKKCEGICEQLFSGKIKLEKFKSEADKILFSNLKAKRMAA